MITRYITILLLTVAMGFSSVSLAGGITTYKRAHEVPSKGPQIVAQRIPVSSFNALQANDPIDITLRPGKQSQVLFYLPKGSTASPTASVNNGLLVLNSGSGLFRSNTRISAIVTTPTLNQIILGGEARLKGTLFAHRLAIETRGNAQANLNGQLDMAFITSHDNSLLDAAWVDSPRVTVAAEGQSLIRLAGRATWLKAHLRDSAVLQAEYLRAKRNWVQTQNNALAYVISTKNLRGFAYDNSQIFYYKWPHHNTQHSEGSGNILQAAWHN